MLQLREYQFDIFSNIEFEAFCERMACHLRETFRVVLEDVDASCLRSFIEIGIKNAKSSEFLSRAEVRRYLEYLVDYGLQFDRLPWVDVILSDDGLSIPQKIKAIDEYAVFDREHTHSVGISIE